MLATYALVDGEKRAPTTPMETQLQQLWAAILKIPAESIGRDDSFLRIGGDSITAIQFVTAAREAGYSIAVRDIFADPRLSAVAAKVGQDEGSRSHETAPFGMVPVRELDDIKQSVKTSCGLASEMDVEDAYPCTSLQEGLMALALKQPGSYIAKHIYRLPRGIDEARFSSAWAQTVQHCDALRTRIISRAGESIQAVIRETTEWENTAGFDLYSFMASVKSIEMKYGSRLCRYALVREESGKRYFVLILHHAIFDGWSMNLILGTLQAMYQGKGAPSLQPYSGFIHYTSTVDQEAAGAFWKAQLEGAHPAEFPRVDPTADTKTIAAIMKTKLDFPKLGTPPFCRFLANPPDPQYPGDSLTSRSRSRDGESPQRHTVASPPFWYSIR